MGYAKRHREGQRKYRKTDNGKEKHKKAEQRRRLRTISGEKRKDKEKRINKKTISAKQHNPQTTAVNKVNRKKTSGPAGKKNRKKQFKNDSQGACIICGAVGDILNKIYWDCRKPQYFSFRVKRTMIDDNNGKTDKEEFQSGFLNAAENEGAI